MSAEEIQIKSGAVVPKTISAPLTRRLEESARLSRFFSKLLGEALHLSADSVCFQPQGESMAVCMRQGKTELKAIEIKASWYEPMLSWLCDRFAVLSESADPSSYVFDKGNSKFDFVANARLGSQIASFRVRTSKPVGTGHVLTLSELSVSSRDRAIDMLGMHGPARILFERSLASESGILLVAAPSSMELAKNRAALLAITGANNGGDLGDASIKAEISKLSRSEILVLSVLAEDATDALLKFKEFGVDLHQLHVAGVLCQGFARRTCPTCARKAVVDSKLAALLPADLVPVSWEGYVVGRGCEECGQRGQKGVIGIQSFLCVDDNMRAMLCSGASHESILKVAYPAGTRSLLEDGLAKVQEGALTLQALFELTKVLPAAYNLVRTEAAEAAKRAALQSAGEGQGADSKPLFSLGPVGKARAKPLLLVVEDDPDQRAILDMVFKATNYDVVSACNGKEALDMIEKTAPDMIISDLMMPTMDGAELVSKLKSNPTLAKIPVLILTVVSDGDKEYALLDMGADDYCEKTVQRKILLKRVENLIKRTRN